jgi:hypothetical protein
MYTNDVLAKISISHRAEQSPGCESARPATREAQAMFDDFSYKSYRVRAGVRQRGPDGLGKWYGVISLVRESQQSIISLEGQLFDWPAAARRHAIRYARALIDSRLDGASGHPNALSPSADCATHENPTSVGIPAVGVAISQDTFLPAD